MAKKTKKELAIEPRFDPWNLVTNKDRAETLLNDINVTGTFNGLAYVMPNPDPILKRLGWNKDIEAYQEILADPQLYGAIENNRKPGVKSLEVYLDNEKCQQTEVEFFKKYFDKLIRDNIYDNITSQVLDTPQFGRMVFGLVWDNIDGYFLPKKIIPMPHGMCKFDANGELLIQDQFGSFNKADHPAKFIVLQHKPTPDNPYGEALLSKCYWNVKFKREGFKIWAIFVEKFGIPWVTAKYNPNLLANTYGTDPTSAAQILLDSLSSMARDGIIIFPEGTELAVTSGGNPTSVDVFERLVRICDEQNTKLQLGHSGATESTSGDKLSNDTTATDVRWHIIEADKKYPVMFWNKIISWIHQFNFTGAEMPIYDLYAKEDVDLAIAERDAKLVPVLQLSGQKLSKAYLQKTYGFIDEDLEEADTLAPVQPVATAKTDIKALVKDTTFSAKAEDEFPDQNLIDDEVDQAVLNSKSTEAIMAQVIELINNADSYDDVKDKIGDMLKKIKSDDFQTDLVNLLFASDLVGRFAVKSELKMED